MANLDRPNGFRPIGTLDGSPWNARVRVFQAADRSSDATGNHGDLYVGDPVELSSGAVQVADSGDTVLGVVVAVGKQSGVNQGTAPFNPENLEQKYLPLADDGYVWVCLANGVVFEAQTASSETTTIGASLDMNTAANTAHGSQTTGMSNVELTTDSNSDVQILAVSDLVDENDATAANAKLQVIFSTITFTQ